MKKFKVQDTITYLRAFYVMAKDEETAIAIVSDGHIVAYSEFQVDATPYEAEEIQGVGIGE